MKRDDRESVPDPGGRVPDWLLERVALGEVPARHAPGLDARLAADPSATSRLAAIASDNQAILARHPAPEVAAEVARRQRARAGAIGPRRHRWAGVAVAATAAVALFLVLRPGPDPDRSRPNPTVQPPEAAGSERVKGGGPHLRIHRQRGAGSEPLVPNQRVAAGDRLQLSYARGEARYGVVLSIDGRGSVTIHCPDPETGDTALSAARSVVFLDHSYRLDDAPRFERFFLVTSHHPIAVAAVRSAAERLASQPRGAEDDKLALESDLEQSSFLLYKVSR